LIFSFLPYFGTILVSVLTAYTDFTRRTVYIMPVILLPLVSSVLYDVYAYLSTWSFLVFLPLLIPVLVALLSYSLFRLGFMPLGDVSMLIGLSFTPLPFFFSVVVSVIPLILHARFISRRGIPYAGYLGVSYLLILVF
jgi:hypothetical protein